MDTPDIIGARCKENWMYPSMNKCMEVGGVGVEVSILNKQLTCILSSFQIALMQNLVNFLMYLRAIDNSN